MIKLATRKIEKKITRELSKLNKDLFTKDLLNSPLLYILYHNTIDLRIYLTYVLNIIDDQRYFNILSGSYGYISVLHNNYIKISTIK